jgi:transcriptional regulator with XRE-family HTH domain
MSKDPDPLDAFVGARIRHRRVALGISSHQFAKHLGITHQEAEQYELGNRRIGSQRLFHIARALEVGIDFFFCPCDRILGLLPMDSWTPPPTTLEYKNN